MTWKGIDIFRHDTAFPFMKWKEWAIGMSIVVGLISLALMYKPGLNYSIDFKGGTLIEIQSKTGPADLGAIREKVNKLGLGEVLVQGVQGFKTDDTDVLLRVTAQEGGDKAQAAAIDKIKAGLGDSVVYRRTESVGPTVSGELRWIGIYAVLASLAGIGIYVWFRFEWQFALGCIVALWHDVLVTVGAFVILQYDFDINVLGALLTIIGYSVNDTVVIYDRIRENLRKYKKMPIEQLIDMSINEMLARTIMVSATVFIALLALYFFGPHVIHNFTFAMLFGVLIGTYSSIFIAAPILVYFGVKRDWSGALPGSAKTTEKAAG
jgi:preprotein translocase subunit SecF